MDYRQLHFFLSVCEQKSMSKAAEVCYVSQQAISKSLSNLEQELGLMLFERTPSGIRLTDAGKVLELKARSHLRDRDDILRSMRSFRAYTQIRISFFMGLLQIVPPHFFIDFQKKYPDIRFHYFSYTDNWRGRDFIDYDSDLIVTTNPLYLTDYTQIIRLERPIGLIVSENNPMASLKKIRLSDLKGLPLITINNENRSQAQLAECLKNHGISIDCRLGETDWELVYDLLKQGYASFYAGEGIKLPPGTVLLEVSDLNQYWEFLIYAKTERLPSAVLDDLVREICRAVSPDIVL